jgi:hypothetical protein
VHAEWQVVGPEHWGLRIKAKGRVSVTFKPVPTTELEKLSSEILVLEDRITRFTAALFRTGATKIINQMNPPGVCTENSDSDVVVMQSTDESM